MVLNCGIRWFICSLNCFAVLTSPYYRFAFSISPHRQVTTVPVTRGSVTTTQDLHGIGAVFMSFSHRTKNHVNLRAASGQMPPCTFASARQTARYGKEEGVQRRRKGPVLSFSFGCGDSQEAGNGGLLCAPRAAGNNVIYSLNNKSRRQSGNLHVRSVHYVRVRLHIRPGRQSGSSHARNSPSSRT